MILRLALYMAAAISFACSAPVAAAEQLSTIKVATLVMVGDDEDHGASGGLTHFAAARQLAVRIPGARLVVLKDQGHYYCFSAHE